MLPYPRWALLTVVLALPTACSGPQSEFPANPGYLRPGGPGSGRLIIFDAATFDVYRSVKLPPASLSLSHRLEIGPAGRIWIGKNQRVRDGIFFVEKAKDRVLVFSPEGDLEHEINPGCGWPGGGIAFANGYAFAGCASSVFYGRVFVIATNAMEVVKTFDRVLPPDGDPSEPEFLITGGLTATGRQVDICKRVGGAWLFERVINEPSTGTSAWRLLIHADSYYACRVRSVCGSSYSTYTG